MDNVDNVENTDQEEAGFGSNHIQDLIKASLDQDYNHANKIFGEVMTIKMSDLMDQEKIRMADQVYNGAPEEEEVEPSDEDLEDDTEENEEAEAEDEDEEHVEEDDEEEEIEGAAV